MKCLLAYYSRSGSNEKVAKMIEDLLYCDVERIETVKGREGVLGFMRSGYEAFFGKLTEIKSTRRNPAEYDLVIVGTPVWAGSTPSPIRTYLSVNKGSFKKIAFFSCSGNGEPEKAFAQMKSICGKDPTRVLTLRQEQVEKNEYSDAVLDFAGKLK
jgi:flavodoxin